MKIEGEPITLDGLGGSITIDTENGCVTIVELSSDQVKSLRHLLYQQVTMTIEAAE